MSMANFDRQYIFQAGQKGATGFEINSSSSAVAIHIQFGIEKSDSETANTAKITLWNLTNAHRKALEKSNCKVILKAGYGSNLAMILDGTVVSCNSALDNGNIATDLEIVDGLIAIRDTYVSLHYKGKTDCKKLFDEIAKQMGVSVTYSSRCKFNTLPHGFSFIGAGKNALKELCRTCKLSWTIQNGVLLVYPPNQAIKNKAYLLNAKTGLIGIPQKITIEEKNQSDSSASATKRTGYEIEYFMNGAIGVGDLIRLESNAVVGDFVVKSIQINGDNVNGDWMCTAKVLETATSKGAVTRTSKVMEKEVVVKKSVATKKAENTSVYYRETTPTQSIVKGSKVKITRTFKQGSRVKAYQYSGGTFNCYYGTFDVISVNGDRVVIGIGSVVTAAINIKDLALA